jgi:hypothetical protein
VSISRGPINFVGDMTRPRRSSEGEDDRGLGRE